MQGLEAQLLREVVAQERGELEEAKERLLLSLAADTRQLQDLQDRILKLLKVLPCLPYGQLCSFSCWLPCNYVSNKPPSWAITLGVCPAASKPPCFFASVHVLPLFAALVCSRTFHQE